MAQEGSRGVTVKDVAAQDFVIAYAAHLKRIGKIEVPKWADLVKTAAFKELAPYDQDWYYIRAGGSWPSRDSPPPPRHHTRHPRGYTHTHTKIYYIHTYICVFYIYLSLYI